MTHLMEHREIVRGNGRRSRQRPPLIAGRARRGLAVAALAATLVALAPSAIAGDHGDTPETATRLGYGSGVPGTLETRDDVDVFRLDLQGRAELLITSHGDTDARGRLLDAAGDQIAEDDDSGTDFNFLMRETVDGGVYYVEVSSAFDAGSYVLLARIRKPGDDHGDTPGASTPLPLNVRMAGSLTEDDVDVFRIDVPVATDLRAYTLGSTNTRGVLSDSGGNRIRTASSGGDGGNFRIETPVQAGIYYLEVAADGTGSYGVRADVDDDGSCPRPGGNTGGGEAPEPDPPFSCDVDLRRSFLVGGTQTVSIASSDAQQLHDGPIPIEEYIIVPARMSNASDYHVYKVVLTQPGELFVTTLGALDTEAVFFDSDCANVGRVLQDVGIIDGVDPLNRWNFGFLEDLGPGTYYFVVYEYDGEVGAYELGVEFTPSSSNASTKSARQLEDLYRQLVN